MAIKWASLRRKATFRALNATVGLSAPSIRIRLVYPDCSEVQMPDELDREIAERVAF
jgi:hypothetical protein